MNGNNSSRFPTIGEAFSAQQFHSLKRLYSGQDRAAEGIVRTVHEIALASYARRRRAALRDQTGAGGLDGGNPAQPLHETGDLLRPHHVITIDGGRGTGKTSVLLTIRPYLAAMRVANAPPVASSASREVLDDIVAMKLPLPEDSYASVRTALVLPIMFTEDMELQESTMEAVFALLEEEIEVRLKSAHDGDEKQKLKALRDELRGGIGIGWTYSRKIGAEALPNDSLNYDDFVRRRAEYSRLAYTRVKMWRQYVDRILNTLGFELLVLIFDDSDLNPDIAEDMIRTIRMYFTHPRVVSIVAVDIPTLQRTLLTRNISRQALTPPYPWTDYADAITSLNESLVAHETRNVKALMEKVLPRPTRHRLSLANMTHVESFFSDEKEKGSGCGFQNWCQTRFEASTGEDRAAWWLLFGPYRRSIASDLRALAGFQYRTRNVASPPFLAVIDQPALTQLAVRFDYDVNNIRSQIENGTFRPDAQSDTLSAEEQLFIDLCIDAGIAANGLSLDGLDAASEWLRQASDDFKEQRTQLIDGHFASGVAGALDHEVMPRNCLYMWQLRWLAAANDAFLPDPSLLVEGLNALGEEIGSHQTWIEAASRDTQVDTGGAQIIDFIREQVSKALRSSKTNEAETPIIVDHATDAALFLAVAALSGQGKDPNQDEFRQFFLDVANGDETAAEKVVQFALRLRDAMKQSERQRQEAIVIWAGANAVTGLGDRIPVLVADDNWFDFEHWAAPTLDVGMEVQKRLKRLAKRSRACVESNARHGLLLAWSVVPLLEILHEFGSDYGRAADLGSVWRIIAEVFSLSLAPLERIMANKTERAWLFPDMDNGELLDRVVENVRSAQSALEELYKPETAAGTAKMDSFWSLTPARRVAALLGVSEKWAAKNLAIHP